MPKGDRTIGLAARGEDEAGVVAPNTRQRARLIGHLLSLHDIREGPDGLPRISAPPPSPALTGGGCPSPARQDLLLEWDGTRERTCF